VLARGLAMMMMIMPATTTTTMMMMKVMKTAMATGTMAKVHSATSAAADDRCVDGCALTLPLPLPRALRLPCHLHPSLSLHNRHKDDLPLIRAEPPASDACLHSARVRVLFLCQSRSFSLSI
jgi:hypothetical protein